MKEKIKKDIQLNNNMTKNQINITLELVGT